MSDEISKRHKTWIQAGIFAATALPGASFVSGADMTKPWPTLDRSEYQNFNMQRHPRLNCILSYPSGKNPNPMEVQTDRSGLLKVASQEMLAKLEQYANGRMVVIEHDPHTREMLRFYPAGRDVLQVIGDANAESEAVMVHAMMRPTLLYLRKDHPRFKELYALLQGAYKARQTVALAVTPGDKWVEDARLDISCS